MSDYLDSPKFLFGFQVHHLLPVEVFRDEILDELLMRAGVFPVRLKPDDWTSGNNNWVLDVIAPDSKTTVSVIANFGRVLGPRGVEGQRPDREEKSRGATERSSGGEARNEGNLKLHPIVTRLVDDETLKKIGAEKMDRNS